MRPRPPCPLRATVVCPSGTLTLVPPTMASVVVAGGAVTSGMGLLGLDRRIRIKALYAERIAELAAQVARKQSVKVAPDGRGRVDDARALVPVEEMCSIEPDLRLPVDALRGP